MLLVVVEPDNTAKRNVEMIYDYVYNWDKYYNGQVRKWDEPSQLFQNSTVVNNSRFLDLRF